MSNFVFNIAKGRVNELAKLAEANDALIAVPLEASGLEADSVLIDKDDLAAVLSGATNEQATMGRETLTSVVVTADDSNDRQGADADDATWVAATGNAVAKLLICYVPDTTSSTDADIVPLVAVDWAVTPAGADITAVFNSGGFFRAS